MNIVSGIYGAHGGYETTEVRDVRRIGGGRGLREDHDKEWMGCFLGDLGAFGITADWWVTATQDEGKMRRTAKQGAEGFMAKWIAAAELRHAVVCPNATGRTEERIAQNKRARVGSLVIDDQR